MTFCLSIDIEWLICVVFLALNQIHKAHCWCPTEITRRNKADRPIQCKENCLPGFLTSSRSRFIRTGSFPGFPQNLLCGDRKRFCVFCELCGVSKWTAWNNTRMTAVSSLLFTCLEFGGGGGDFDAFCLQWKCTTLVSSSHFVGHNLHWAILSFFLANCFSFLSPKQKKRKTMLNSQLP